MKRITTAAVLASALLLPSLAFGQSAPDWYRDPKYQAFIAEVMPLGVEARQVELLQMCGVLQDKWANDVTSAADDIAVAKAQEIWGISQLQHMNEDESMSLIPSKMASDWLARLAKHGAAKFTVDDCAGYERGATAVIAYGNRLIAADPMDGAADDGD